MTYTGQFIVSRDRIHRNSREMYKWLLQTLGERSHFVHDDYPSDPWFDDQKAVDNPKFGHTLERAWLFIFGCDDMAIAEECDGMDNRSAFDVRIMTNNLFVGENVGDTTFAYVIL